MYKMRSSEKSLNQAKKSAERKDDIKANNNGNRFNDKAFEDLDAQLTQYLLSNKAKKSKFKKSVKKLEVRNIQSSKTVGYQALEKGSQELNQKNNLNHEYVDIVSSNKVQEKESNVQKESGKYETSHRRRNHSDTRSYHKIDNSKSFGRSQGTADSKTTSYSKKGKENRTTSYIESVPPKSDKQREIKQRQNNLASQQNTKTMQKDTISSRKVKNNDIVMSAYNKLFLRAELVQRSIDLSLQTSSVNIASGVEQGNRNQIHSEQVHGKTCMLADMEITSTVRSSSSSDDFTSESSSDSELSSTDSSSNHSSTGSESDSDNNASNSKRHGELPIVGSNGAVSNQSDRTLDCVTSTSNGLSMTSAKTSSHFTNEGHDQLKKVSVFDTNQDHKTDKGWINDGVKDNQICETKSKVSVFDDLSDISDEPFESDSENIPISARKSYLAHSIEARQVERTDPVPSKIPSKADKSDVDIGTNFKLNSAAIYEEQIVPTHNSSERSCASDVEQNSSFFEEIFAGVLYVPECLSPIKDEILPNEPDIVDFGSRSASNRLNVPQGYSNAVGIIATEIDVNQACWNISIPGSQAESTPKKSDADKLSVCSSTSSSLKLKFKRCKDRWSVSYSEETFNEKGRSIRSTSEAGRSIRSVCQSDYGNVPILVDTTVSFDLMNEMKASVNPHEFGRKDQRDITKKLPIDTSSYMKNAIINKVYMKRAYTQNGCVILRT